MNSQNQHYQKILKKIGLSAGESKLYLAGLSLGPSLASELARTTKTSRTLTYHFLGLLEKRGLVTKVGPKHGQRFVMEPPKRLKWLLERRKKEVERIEAQLEESLGGLESLEANKQQESRVCLYRGKEAMKNVAEDILNCQEKEFYSLVAVESLPELMERDFMGYFVEEREKKGIRSKSIWSSPEESLPYTNTGLREFRLLPEGMSCSSSLLIYDNKVAVISSPQSNFFFKVESEDFAQTMKAMFEQIWEQSRQIDPKKITVDF